MEFLFKAPVSSRSCTRRKCVSIDPTLAGIVKRAEPLTAYAWKFRYPGEPYEPETAEAEEVLEIARIVFEEILRRLTEVSAVPEPHGHNQ
jgi:hypothetical protein